MHWPAILRYENCDELEILNSASDWQAHAERISLNCQLIDSSGTVYNAVLTAGSKVELQADDHHIDSAQAITLARAHMAAQAHCCVSKFTANSVAEVIAALVQLDDE